MTDSEQVSARQVRRVGSWLGLLTPCFALSGKQITVLKEPTEFYDVLKVKDLIESRDQILNLAEVTFW
jgi:hypothetical protein